MNIFIGYDELSDHIKDRFNQEITLQYVSNKSVKVTYKKKALMVAVPLSVNFSLTEIKADSISMKYHAFVGIDRIISMALKMIAGRHPELKEAIHIDGELCTINLSEVKNAGTFTQHFAIKDITLSTEGINILASFKMADGMQKYESLKTIEVETMPKDCKTIQTQPTEKDRSKWIASFKNTLKKLFKIYFVLSLRPLPASL